MKDFLYNPIFQGVRKTFALLVCMLFAFVFIVSPIKVKAEAFPIPPLWLPMNPYNAQGLEGNYVLLNDDQKKIVNEVLGAVNIVYLGFGGYALTGGISGIRVTRQFYQEYGSAFLNTFWSQIMGTSRAMTDFVGSTIYKASTYDTYEEYEQDTAPSLSSENHKYFQISPELTVAFKNWYRANGGVEDWQLQTKPFTSSVTYKTTNNVSGAVVQQYNNYINTLTEPLVRANATSYNWYNCVVSAPTWFNNYDCLLLNTTYNGFQLYSSSGVPAPNITYDSCFYTASYNFGNSGSSNTYIGGVSFNPSNYNSYVEIVRALYNFQLGQFLSGYNLYFEDWIKHVYVGANWTEKQEIFNIDDLNIGTTPSEYIDNISDTGYVDINTLIGQVADEVINLRDVVEEAVLVKDGDTAIPYADSLQVAIDKYINQPDSGVVIPVDLFGGLTGANGPVSYLWFMTKPLVSYTGDLIGLLTLEGDGTFQFTGLGYIVIGVVTVGIIGGLVTKCLL